MDKRNDLRDHQCVVAAVIHRGDRYLVCQRPDHKRHGGLWEFPGGKVHLGETTSDAVQRELAEELGLQVRTVGKVVYEAKDHGSHFLIEFTLTSVNEDAPTQTEHKAIAWKTVAEMLDMPMAPCDLAFVQELAAQSER